jgi:serine/threonine protein kinase
MKSLLILLLTTVTYGSFAQPMEDDKLTATLKAFHQALINKNTIAINQQTDKALSYGHSNGWIQTKADVIKDLETGYISYQDIKEDSITITMNGNMANVRFLGDYKATLKGAASNFRLRVLEVWVKKSKRWVLFARQGIRFQ